MPGLNTFLLVIAAIFPVVNPPGSALIFLGLTLGATPEIRRLLARRVAINSFIVLVCSLLLGALILQFYGISIPILRVAGGFIVAVSGWKLLNDGSHKYIEAPASEISQKEILNMAFYPLTLPLTTGPGTIAVVISLGLSRGSSTNLVDEIIFMIACLLAVAVIALTIFFCFKYSERIQKLLGQGGTDIAVRLFAFILFCLGVQILWSGGSELLRSVIHAAPPTSASAEVGYVAEARSLMPIVTLKDALPAGWRVHARCIDGKVDNRRSTARNANTAPNWT